MMLLMDAVQAPRLVDGSDGHSRTRRGVDMLASSSGMARAAGLASHQIEGYDSGEEAYYIRAKFVSLVGTGSMQSYHYILREPVMVITTLGEDMSASRLREEVGGGIGRTGDKGADVDKMATGYHKISADVVWTREQSEGRP